MSRRPNSPTVVAPARRGGPGAGLPRFVRGFFLAQVCLALSVGGHVAAEGSVHLTAETLVGWVLLSAVCVAAAQRKRSFGGIATIVALSQVALHLMMMPGGHMDGGTHGGMTGAMGGGTGGGMAGGTEAVMHSGMTPAVPSPAMISAHVVATILASILLAHGERLAWALWNLAGLPRVPSSIRPVPAIAGTPLAIGRHRLAPSHGHILPGGATRRGPPVA